MSLFYHEKEFLAAHGSSLFLEEPPHEIIIGVPGMSYAGISIGTYNDGGRCPWRILDDGHGIQDLHNRLCGVAGFKSTSDKVHILFFQGIYYRGLVGLFVGSENPNF